MPNKSTAYGRAILKGSAVPASGEKQVNSSSEGSPNGREEEQMNDFVGRLVERKSGTTWTRYTHDGNDVVLDSISLTCR